MDMSNSVNGEDIRSHRERDMMTQEELAERLGVPVEQVADWEAGTRSVPKARMGVIRDVLSIGELKTEFGREALLRRIGQLAKERREQIGIGRVPFAKELGMSDSTIRDFEFGRRAPMGSTQRKVEKGLGWRYGAIDDVLRMVDRKASNISMEEIDAEDSLRVGHDMPGMRPLAFASNDELLAELRRRMEGGEAFPKPESGGESAELYGLAASTNVEHLEEEGE